MRILNDLLNVIDKRINKQLKETSALTSIPCRVLEVFTNGTVRVLVIQNNTEYVVPNYTGSDLLIGEEVQLFCQGSILSGRFMYIGAAVNKQSGGSSFGCVSGNSMTGEILTNERIISRINIRCKSGLPCLLFFNATVFGSSSGNLTINSYIDDIANDFTVTNTIHADEYSVISFSLPLVPSVGEHIVSISAVGVGNIVSLNSCIIGSQIEEYDIRETTGENDYIYTSDENQSSIIYYIGQSKYPEIPAALQGRPVKKLLATSFNYSDIISAYIPEGVEEIE